MTKQNQTQTKEEILDLTRGFDASDKRKEVLDSLLDARRSILEFMCDFCVPMEDFLNISNVAIGEYTLSQIVLEIFDSINDGRPFVYGGYLFQPSLDEESGEEFITIAELILDEGAATTQSMQICEMYGLYYQTDCGLRYLFVCSADVSTLCDKIRLGGDLWGMENLRIGYAFGATKEEVDKSIRRCEVELYEFNFDAESNT